MAFPTSVSIEHLRVMQFRFFAYAKKVGELRVKLYYFI